MASGALVYVRVIDESSSSHPADSPRPPVGGRLVQEEVEAGLVLTCQSHPLSDQVLLDRDL